MNIIVLPNVDGKIWNLEFKVLEIVTLIDNYKEVVISLNGEGPCARSIGLYDLLDKICEYKNINKNKIRIKTNNVLESHSSYIIEKSGPLYLDSVKDFMSSNTFDQHKNWNDMKHFGLFVGRSNWTRLRIASELALKYKDKSSMTFHYNRDSDFHKEHVGVEDLINHGTNWTDIYNAINLLENSPVLLENKIPLYPIITPSHFEIAKVYHNFFVEIICETYCQGNTFYPTEKLWRPIAMRTPFIIQGPMNYYHNLHKMGFKTFDRWWSEGFTNDDYTYHINEIFEILEYLSSLTIEELEGLYIDMQEILDHNYKLLKSLTPTDFVKGCNG